VSVQAITWVLENCPAKYGARLILLSIANHADRYGQNAWPSMASIAREAGLSTRQVERMVPHLARMGWLRVEPRGGPNGTHKYALPLMPDPDILSGPVPTSAPAVPTSAVPPYRHLVRGNRPEPSIEPSALPEEKQTLLEHRSGLHDDAPRLRCSACKEAS
jgi:hypothetical protein